MSKLKTNLKMSLSKELANKMIDGNIYRTIDLYENQDKKYIETTILSVLKEQKLSLSQVRAIFNDILRKIEDKNLINL